VKWPTRKRAGRLPSLGQDFDAGHRSYVENLRPAHELWLHRKPFYAPPNDELARCLHTFAHAKETLDLGLRAQVLDVGCGPGWLSELLARSGYWVTGVDISADMIRIAKERMAELPTPLGEGVSEPATEFFAMPVREMPWTDRFEAALLYDALHHFDDELETLRVIQRTLVPGGRIYIEEGVRPPPGSEAEQTLIAEMEEYGTLESPFDPEYLVEVLEASGFDEITRFARVDELFEIGREREASARVGRMMRYPDLNTIVARKPGRRGGTAFAAELSALGGWEERGDALALRLLVANTGRSYWPTLESFPYPEGTVTVGPYVEKGDAGRTELPRAVLPAPVSPGGSVEVELVVPRAVLERGQVVRVDLVREGLAWFSTLGSQPLDLPPVG
jgi:SAM-dependent methyltransferase